MPSEARRAKGGFHLFRPASNGTPSLPIRNAMYYVYLIRSQAAADQVYTGFTEDLRQRLLDHNAGKSIHTKKYLPWTLETYLAFSDRNQALDFERYLKTGSGIAFAKKRLRPFHANSSKMENSER